MPVPPPAQLSQERHVEYVTGARQRFVVTSSMIAATIPDQLPSLFVFVLLINDRADPKADTLARVARIADLTTLPQGREAGLASATGVGIEYISTICTLSYYTLTDAIAGAQAVQDRVSALITEWSTFNSEFNAPDPAPDVINLPLTVPTQKQALIDAYTAAKQACYQQFLTTEEADAAFTRAQTDYTYKQGLANSFAAVVSKMTTVSSEMTTLTGAYTTLKNAGDVFYAAASCAAAGDKATFQAALNVAANQIVLNSGYSTDAAALSTLISTFNSTLTSAVSAAATALEAAQTNKTAEDQAFTDARALQTSTLNALLAVAPDFPPTIVPYLPGTATPYP